MEEFLLGLGFTSVDILGPSPTVGHYRVTCILPTMWCTLYRSDQHLTLYWHKVLSTMFTAPSL